MRTLKNVYKTYIDVIGFVKTDKKRYENDAEKPEGEPEAQEEDQEMNENMPVGEEEMD
jgi:hypothetical protein